ncbi:MAG: hypothetical protein ACI379_08600 [Nocardioides sp.]|uniref:hypothetical protein n=1 Tax=Nocardioides sp. TaxID=35761 RepID=UPI003F10F4CE
MIDTEQRPVLWGLAALGVAALAAGLVGGLALVFGMGLFGLGGGDAESTGEPAAKETLYLPTPTPTETEKPSDSSEEPAPDAPEETEEPEKEKGIQLETAQTTVSPMAAIDISGTADSADGSVLRVQRLEDGAWKDFPVTALVSGKQFSTVVQTGRAGINKFRMIDTNTGVTSNPVEVTIA